MSFSGVMIYIGIFFASFLGYYGVADRSLRHCPAGGMDVYPKNAHKVMPFRAIFILGCGCDL